MIQASDKIAIIDGDKQYTYKRFLQYVTVFAEQLDVRPGSIVMIYSEPRFGYAVALYSIWAKQCKYTTFYHTLSEDDLLWAINDLKPSVVFTSVAQFQKVTSAIMRSQMPIQVLVLDDMELADVPQDIKPAMLKYRGSSTAGIIYTVGITQQPRPAILTFDNYICHAHAILKNKIITGKDTVITMLPFFNTWVLLSTLVHPLYFGAKCVLCHSNDPAIIQDTIKKNKVTVFVCVNSVYTGLLGWTVNIINAKLYRKVFYQIAHKLKIKWISKLLFKKIHKEFGNSLRYFITVGNQIIDDIWQHFIALGFDVYEGYGMQETSSLITIPASKRVNPTSVGKFFEEINYKIIDNEIVIQGPCISKQYYERPFLNNINFNWKWFFTGDNGWVDADGWVYITGRTTEAISLPSGRVVFPIELETELASRSKYIKEVGVFYNDNLLKAIIVPTTEMLELFGTENDFEKIFHYIKWQIIENYNYAVPAHKRIKKIIISKDALKRSTSGKLKRYLLQDNQTIIDEKIWNNATLYNIE